MNGILLVDKPQDWTSNDVVCKLKGVLHERRIGHSGTLDPMATGLLVVFVGRATRAVQFAENNTKRYLASIRLGLVTDTLDITGNVIQDQTYSVTDEDFQACLTRFQGDLIQIPPMYSAIKVNGRKLYDIARTGKTIERKGRAIHIDSLSFLGYDELQDRVIDVTCSKGTYIRSLCDDIGKSLGCGASMSALRRIQCGTFHIENAVPLDELISCPLDIIETERLLPVDSLFDGYSSLTVSLEEETKIKNGNSVSSLAEDGIYRVYSGTGEFLMLGQCKNGILYTIKNFFEVS